MSVGQCAPVHLHCGTVVQFFTVQIQQITWSKSLSCNVLKVILPQKCDF